ncbi:uncharacterized protein LOC142769404 [Rhipicephalus microplus]|uniref:uncharacterized protein LOC142769404 n=1 Tax=Rhipicephalus microplus TaxID=6941 RepID=UPI003F6C4565
MEGFEDLSIKPCDDLYRHACGYWLTRTSNPSSFMEDVARNYSRILRNVLSDGGARSDSNLVAGALKYISRYYASCFEFFDKSPSVKEVVAPLFEYLNITFKTWLETANKQAMLNALVDLSVRFRLHSFFRVDVIEHLEAPPTWYIERGWAFMYCISGRVVVDVRDRAASYLADVLRVVDANAATNSTVTRVIELDIARMTESTDNDDQRDAIDQKVPLGNLTCDIFHDGVSWLRALQTVPGDTQKLTANTTVHVSSFKGTCDHLAAALGDSNKRVGPLYSLALVASDVLRYHYRLAGHGSDERPNQDALHGVCYELTQSAFRGAWLEIIGAFVGLKGDAGEFMKSYVHFMTSRLQAFTDWMLDDDRDRVVRNFGSYGLAGLDVPQLDYQKLRCSRYHDSIVLRKEDFIYNRVTVYAPALVNCTRRATQFPEAVLKYLEGTELVVSSAFEAVVLPHMFGLPPLHYNIKEEYVNYAIGGTLLARKFFHVVLNGTWTRYTMEKMLNGRQCYLGMSSRFHDSLKDGDFHDVLSTAEVNRTTVKCIASDPVPPVKFNRTNEWTDG